jgi:hypothetical protein
LYSRPNILALRLSGLDIDAAAAEVAGPMSTSSMNRDALALASVLPLLGVLPVAAPPVDSTAAHRSLPFGSRMIVSSTKRKIDHRDRHDRGPFTHGVTLDLAFGAAHARHQRDPIGLHILRNEDRSACTSR